MNKILVANWKANPQTLEEARVLFVAEQKGNVIICPPAVYIAELHPNGAQDVFWEEGPHTGQIGPTMLKQFGVTHVLVGHSEQRALGETDEQINKKLKAVLRADMAPILLVGEPEQSSARSDYLIDQLTRDLESISVQDAKKILYTYEPAWAISTKSGNRSDTPENAFSAIHEMQMILEKSYKLQVASFKFLYGGSVNEKNVESFLKHTEISGAVVGGASLRPDEFKNMIEIVAEL